MHINRCCDRLHVVFLLSFAAIAACSSTEGSSETSPKPGSSAELSAASGPAADFRPKESIALVSEDDQLGMTSLRVILAEHAPDFCDHPNVEWANGRSIQIDFMPEGGSVETKTYDLSTDDVFVSFDVLDGTCKQKEAVMANEGTITITEVGDTSVRGTFSIVLDGARTDGAFDAPLCDIGASIAKLPKDAKRECR